MTLTDEQILLRNILREPWCDTARLVYADWLEERRRAERAEFIRLEIEKANTGQTRCMNVEYRRDQRPWGCGECRFCKLEIATESFHDTPSKWSQIMEDLPFGYAHTSRSSEHFDYDRFVSLYTVRGFVSNISCTLAEFMDSKCGGNGWEECDDGAVYDDEGTAWNCSQCHGTGTFPGFARVLFGEHPITKVVITDKEALDNENVGTYFGETGDPADTWFWLKNSGVGAETRWEIPAEIFAHLEKDNFGSQDEADAALSLAAVNYARKLHKLPLLTMEQV